MSIEELARNQDVEHLLAYYDCPPHLIPDVAQDIYLYLLEHPDRLEHYFSIGLGKQYLSKVCRNNVSHVHSMKRCLNKYQPIGVSFDELEDHGEYIVDDVDIDF